MRRAPDSLLNMTAGLLIGAYERDNFGDVLFLQATRFWLGNRSTIATSPFAGDTRDVGGAYVVPYAPLLLGADVPFLWVVGGETGGTSFVDAAKMVGAPPNTLSDSAMPGFASPYMPRPSRYLASSGAKFIVNSVGLAPAVGLTGRRRIETFAALREATFLSVRDLDSSRLLDQHQIEHRVAPDMVHTIRRAVVLPSADVDESVALIQLKERHIRAQGVREVAATLVASKGLRQYHLRLFSAGEAPGHDSISVLRELADEFRRQGGGTRIDVSRARTAEAKAAEIAGCGLWVGTSLHGFIISTAYGVPRVGLFLRKVERYADAWQIPQPTNVAFEYLDSAISAARATSEADHQSCADRLADAAEENAKAAVAHVDEQVAIPARTSLNARVTNELRRMGPVSHLTERVLRRAKSSVSSRFGSTGV